MLHLVEEEGRNGWKVATDGDLERAFQKVGEGGEGKPSTGSNNLPNLVAASSNRIFSQGCCYDQSSQPTSPRQSRTRLEPSVTGGVH